jgi:uncharacterized protein (TIGR02145 family)
MKLHAAKVKAGFAISFIMFFCFSAVAQTVKDIDGNDYKTIKYGMQEWTANNLCVSHFRNGDSIPEAKTKDEWINLGSKGKPAWCYFDNNPENGKNYGKLYNWYAIADPRGLAPEGWHISTNEDWRLLVKNLLGVDVAGLKLKSTTGWKSKNGTNNIGFSALPGGYRNESGEFKDFGTKGQWWSNSEPVEVKKSNLIYSLMLSDRTVEVSYLKMAKENGLSVRCIKDKN